MTGAQLVRFCSRLQFVFGLAVACCIWVTGCSGETEPGQIYLQRLAGALDQGGFDLPKEESPLPLFPLGDTLFIKRREAKLGVANLLAVHRCELSPLVGARNGGLGRVHTPSQRFLYDLKLLAGLATCTSAGEALREIERERAAELPVAAFNALFAGEEWHDFATPAVAELAVEPDPAGLSRTLANLFKVITLTQADNQITAGFEEDLAVLRFSRALGEQRTRWREQSRVLETATQMLRRAREDNPGCRNGAPTEAGRIRRNVFEIYYAQGFQPQLATQAQPDRGWLLQLVGLLEVALLEVGHLPQARRIAEWHAQVLGLEPAHEFGRWKTALAAHTKAWQWQLRACGLLPVPTSQPLL